jgi:hypothetical protein
VAAAPAQARARAESQWRTARTFGDKADMTLRLVQWLDARGRLVGARTQPDAQAAIDALERIGREELAAAEAALPLYLGDSRMGHLNHGRGCFTALTILAKIDALRRTLDKELPALRKATSAQQPSGGTP